jgi:hypothetical protein
MELDTILDTIPVREEKTLPAKEGQESLSESHPDPTSPEPPKPTSSPKKSKKTVIADEIEVKQRIGYEKPSKKDNPENGEDDQGDDDVGDDHKHGIPIKLL